MKNTTTKLLSASIALIFSVALVSCDVDKKSEGKLPEVDVDIDTKPAELPEYEVNTPDVKTGTKTVEVEVPTVEIESAEDGDDK